MYILIDIGGTKTRVTVTEHREAFLTPVVFETPQDFEEWFRLLTEATVSLLQGRKVTAVIAGVPATFSTDKKIIKHAPHLRSWEGVELHRALEHHYGTPVHLENDTALVGLGEAHYGAGKDHPIVAYITISTGVNGIRIVDGKIDRSTYGFEIGHSIIDNNKEVEYFISGGELEKRYGKPSHKVHDASLWEKVNHYAGVLGANVMMFWSPSVIVYGGPVMNDLHIEIIEKEARQVASVVYDVMPTFVRGTLKDFGGLYGALAKSKEL